MKKKTKFVIMFILAIVLLFNTVKATNIMQLQDAYKAKIIITRYIQAIENEEIKKTYPNWINLTEKQQEELDYNIDGNIDSTDLLIITRHILALEDESIRKTYPNWIIDLDTIANNRANAINQNQKKLHKKKEQLAVPIIKTIQVSKPKVQQK